MKRAGLALALLVSAASPLAAFADTPVEVQISRFSGKPVPRFEALRHETVNGRRGPGEEYKVEWEYARKGLPVLIVKESGDWRYVRDPAGDEVWIKKSQLTAPKYAISLDPFVLKAGRADDSAELAQVGAGVLLDLSDCDGDVCQVTAGKYRGWAPRALLWGADALTDDTKG